MGLNGFPPSPLACALPPHTLSPDPDACARMGWKGCGRRVLDIPSVHPPPQPSTPSSTPTPTSLQSCRLYLSDYPLHAAGGDFVLLAEQRHAEADLKEKYEVLTVELKV
jgi:hypothetical protein